MGKYDEIARGASAAARQKTELEAKIRRFQAAAVNRLASDLAQEGREAATALLTARVPLEKLDRHRSFSPKGWQLPMTTPSDRDYWKYWTLRKDGAWSDSSGGSITLTPPARTFAPRPDLPSLLNDEGTDLRQGVVVHTNFPDLLVVDGKLMYEGWFLTGLTPTDILTGKASLDGLLTLEDALRHAITTLIGRR